MTAKLDQSDEGKEMETDQSDSSSHSESENDPQGNESEQKDNEKEESDKTEEEVTDENKNSPRKDDLEVRERQMSPRRLEVMKRLKFPQELLTLRQVEETEFLQTGIPWSITAQVAVPKGTTIGPYLGETIALSSIKPGELVLQVSHPTFIHVCLFAISELCFVIKQGEVLWHLCEMNDRISLILPIR